MAKNKNKKIKTENKKKLCYKAKTYWIVHESCEVKGKLLQQTLSTYCRPVTNSTLKVPAMVGWPSQPISQEDSDILSCKGGPSRQAKEGFPEEVMCEPSQGGWLFFRKGIRPVEWPYPLNLVFWGFEYD